MLTPLYPVTNEPATVLVVAPGALAGETTLPIAPLTIELTTGQVLDFGEPGKFARLADDAVVDAISLTTDPLPSDILAGDEYEIPGSTAGYGILSEGVKAMTPDDQVALNIDAELVLDLTAGYTGDDAEQLKVAVAHQMNLLKELDVNALRLKSVSPANPGPTRTFRDRWVDPRAAVIVARVTGRKAVRYEPLAIGA